MKNKTGYLFQDSFLDHDLGYGHPESPERLRAIQKHMKETGLDKDVVPIRPLDNKDKVREAIKLIHSTQHFEAVNECDPTGAIAFEAVAGTLGAVKNVMDGTINNAFCAIRPPGHHAHNNGPHYDGAYQGEGFCFYNNIAIAARFAQKKLGCKNIIIVDWDYHHGNGTEWAFYADPTVFFFSTHLLYGYPGTGYPNRYGSQKGEGYTLNVALDSFAGDSEILDAWEHNLLPALHKQDFIPDLVMISAGFDSREDDPLGNFKITDAGFSTLTKIAMGLATRCCHGKLVSVLEGGYNPDGQAKAVCAHIQTLLNGN